MCIEIYTQTEYLSLYVKNIFISLYFELYLLRVCSERDVSLVLVLCPKSGCAKELHPHTLLSVSLVMAGGAAGLYTCQIHLAANFESHPLFKSPLLFLCINNLSAVQY